MTFPFLKSLSGGVPLYGSALQYNAAVPITFELSYLRTLDGLRRDPLWSKSPLPVQWNVFLANNQGTIVSGPMGPGIACTGGSTSGNLAETANNTLSIGSTGSLAMFTTVGFTADGLNRIGLRIGTNSGNSYVGIQRFTDNKIYLGWVDGAGTDFEVSATFATFVNTNDAVVLGCSWNPSTTFGYVKGTQVGTNASPGTFPSLTGGPITINGNAAQSASWSKATTTVIYWVAVWDRQLSQQDFEYLQANPYALFDAPNIPAVARVTIPVSGISLPTLKQNISGQNITFLLINVATGAPLTNATVSVLVTKDNGTQTAGGGVVTELGNGQYNYAPTQTETNATDVGFVFSAPGAIQVNRDFHAWPVDVNSLREVGVAAVSGSTLGAQGEGQAPQSVCWGTVGSGSTTTSVVTLGINNPTSTNATGQFVGRTLIFLGNTTTAALQSAAASITASTTGSTPTLTVTGLTTPPASGDVFVIV